MGNGFGDIFGDNNCLCLIILYHHHLLLLQLANGVFAGKEALFPGETGPLFSPYFLRGFFCVESGIFGRSTA